MNRAEELKNKAVESGIFNDDFINQIFSKPDQELTDEYLDKVENILMECSKKYESVAQETEVNIKNEIEKIADDSIRKIDEIAEE